MNLSQIKREKMMAFLKKLKIENSGNEENLIAINEIENELNNKKYGLIWEEHEENVDKMMEDNVPVFVEDKKREIKINDDEYNFLLEGDNLHSLYLLEKTHKGKIDVIYIDPPYNTGNKDFVYDDDIVGDDDAFRHSKWLSFMNNRLQVAYNLLSNNGVMFISIDDNEVFQLKLLLDTIFGYENFIISMPRITKKSGKTTNAYAKNHDYILIYTKNNKNVFSMEEHTDENFKYSDEYESKRGKYKLNQTLDYDSLSYSSSLDYPLEIEGEVFYPGSDVVKYNERKAGKHRRADWAWRWSKKMFDFGYKNGFIVIKRKKDGSARIYTKTYLNCTIEKDDEGNPFIEYNDRKKPISSIVFIDNQYSNDNAKKDLSVIGLKDTFDYSKPVNLILKLLKSYLGKGVTILDFFAGSGTTAQAVLELNKEDGGNRHFILCTNNENNICEDVTYKRIKTVITGKRDDGSTYSDGISANLKYYKTDFVKKDTKNLSRDLSKHVKELIQLENGVDIDNDKWVMILTEEDAEKFEKNIKKYKNLKGVYRARSVVWTKSQKVLLKGKEDHIIPDYYFNNDLKEVGENW